MTHHDPDGRMRQDLERLPRLTPDPARAVRDLRSKTAATV